jgi:fucose permease
LSGLIIEKAGYVKSLFIAVVCVSVTFLAGFSFGRTGIWILPFSGLFIAVMWPTVMAVAMKVFGGDAPMITSVIITVSGAINGVFQLIIGLTNKYAGESWGYRSCFLYALIVLVMLSFLSQRIKKQNV